MSDKDRITIYDFDYAGDEWRAICPICYCLVPSDKRQAHLDYHAWEASR